ncbi:MULTISPECIES: HsdM family class I SAM-dependent methyltransferase [Bacteroidales]|uniref:HsdM family class I SAM-dependent methyltransferase n=1 Tax=Bacteroidales TaxID=171549 RepID=UPI0013E8F302|nr:MULTISPECIES: N-6 DNA methylase [Bacteroidales]
MFDLRDIKHWRRSFGVYPINVKANTPSQYALLTGGVGDFCLDVSPELDKRNFDRIAWSLNTKNYIAVGNDDVKIYNWLKDGVESIEKRYVENNIDKFYKYILSSSYATVNDVIPFIISLFRKMRNLTHEDRAPLEALNYLYILLLSLSYDDVNTIDFESYGISRVQLPEGFDLFIDDVRSGVKQIKPDLDIILRHCSGPIFQEAHRIVDTFFSERDLFGDVSNKLISSLSDYSSTYYTPQYVARTIVEQCLRNIDINQPNLCIFDPACGSGEFLVEILKQLHGLNYHGNITIKGWDKSECGINTTYFLLKFAQKEYWRERLSICLRVVDDSLIEEWDNDIDIILMNPPYKAWELLNKEERGIVSDVFPFDITKPNLAIPFLYKAFHSLKDSGMLGCVLPSAFFTSDNYVPIRTELNELHSSKLVGKLGNYVFESALTDVSIYVGQKKQGLDFTTLLWCNNEKGIVPKALCALRRMQDANLPEIDKKGYSIYQPDMYPDINDSWKVVSKSDYNLRLKLSELLRSGLLVPLQTIFTVKQGIRTGDNRTFIISKEQYEGLDKTEQRYYRPSIDNGAILNGQIAIKNYVWFPYDERGLLIQTEEQLQSEAPDSYRRFLPIKVKLAGRKSIPNKDHWWILSRHRDWLLKSETRIVSTEFGSAKSFALDVDGIYVIERGHAWIPKRKFSEDDYYFYLAFFSSSTFEKMLSIYSTQLAGGNVYDLSAKFTNQIPILSASLIRDRNIPEFYKLVQLGKAMYSDGSWFYQDSINSVIEGLL